MAYLDDIIILSRIVDQWLIKLRDIFDRFRYANLTLRLDNSFFMKKIEYLDFMISTDVHKVRSFLGLPSYFRRFVLGFSTVARPVSDLLKKGASFCWGRDSR